MDVAAILSGLSALFSAGIDAEEPWANDPELFEDHFGVPFKEFSAKVALLGADQKRRYLATLDVNPEAAVLWALVVELA
jgi:hypothetical protein